MEENRMKQPLISVIVPVYNGEDYLKDCIKSIENQTYTNVEIMIINDGSVDNTERVCHELQAQNTNIRLFYLGDEGVSAARNLGLKEAQGEYIAFVDADDRILPDMLETLYLLLIESNCDIAGCSFLKWNQVAEWQAITEEWSSESEERFVECYDHQRYLQKQILEGNTRCWSKLYRRSALGNQTFRTNYSIGEDMLFLVDLMPKVNQIVETSYRAYGYYQNQNGAMRRKFEPYYMDQIFCWECARNLIQKMNYSLYSQVTARLITAIVLTIGKLAMLSYIERKGNKQYIDICYTKLMIETKDSEAVRYLSKGYYLKLKFFLHTPTLFLWSYHFKKYMVWRKEGK